MLNQIIIKNVNVNEETLRYGKFNWSLTPIVPGCQHLDISNYFDLKTVTPASIDFFFHTSISEKLELIIQEKNKASSKRPIPQNNLGHLQGLTFLMFLHFICYFIALIKMSFSLYWPKNHTGFTKNKSQIITGAL